MKAFAVKFFRAINIMKNFAGKKSWQIPVPAAAAIQEGQAVFIFIGCKGSVDGFFLCLVKFRFGHLELVNHTL
jgi:hypothetical protein